MIEPLHADAEWNAGDLDSFAFQTILEDKAISLNASADRDNIRFDPTQEPMTALGDMAWYSMRAVVEYLRTYLFSGFPWSLIAASIVDYAPLVQFDRVAGPYALGVLILLPSVLVACTHAPF